VLPGGGSAAPTTGGVTAPTTAAPVAPKPSYELYSLKVRFGSSESEVLPESNLKRLTALPDAKEPAIIYLGLLDDHKTAVFLVDSRATVQGDGKCLPSAGNCQNLHLKVGETAFFDMAAVDGQPGAQYQLDVLKVAKKKTSDAKAAKASMAKVARGGRSALRARVARAGRYRYDAKTGTLKRLSPKAYKAAMARASAK
jgi:hypothetical protein